MPNTYESGDNIYGHKYLRKKKPEIAVLIAK